MSATVKPQRPPPGPRVAADDEHPPGHSLLSQLFFFFAAKPIRIARRQGALEVEDCPQSLLRSVQTRQRYKCFEAAWQEEQKRNKPHIIRAVSAGHWPRILATGFLYLISQGSTLAGPLLIKQIVQGLTCRQIVSVAPPGVPGLPSCDSQQTLFLCVTLSHPRILLLPAALVHVLCLVAASSRCCWPLVPGGGDCAEGSADALALAAMQRACSSRL